MQKRLLTQLELQSGIIQIFPKSGNIWICLEILDFYLLNFSIWILWYFSLLDPTDAQFYSSLMDSSYVKSSCNVENVE